MSKTQGNMYEWVTETWNPVGGACPISCDYCFVKDMMRFPVIKEKYSGEPRLVAGPWPKFKNGDTVFVCDMTDLFAMPGHIITRVLWHCVEYGHATYVLQTKVPWMVGKYWYQLPTFSVIGTTFETDLGTPHMRLANVRQIRERGTTTFITIEPIMKFTPEFASKIIEARPSFVNIGADSKRSRMPEPTRDEVLQLIADLRGAGIEVRIKPNLERIVGKGVK